MILTVLIVLIVMKLINVKEKNTTAMCLTNDDDTDSFDLSEGED